MMGGAMVYWVLVALLVLVALVALVVLVVLAVWLFQQVRRRAGTGT
jgi:hypothetical protein